MLLENHAAIRRHSHGADAVPVSVDLHQEIALRKERSGPRPNLVCVFDGPSNILLGEPAFSVIWSHKDVVRALVAADETRAKTGEAIVDGLLVVIILQAQAPQTCALANESLHALPTLLQDPPIASDRLTPNIIELLDFIG